MMKLRSLLLPSLLVSLAVASDALATPVPELGISRSRILLVDVAPNTPAALATTDIGPAPRAGSSRIVERWEMVAALPPGTDEKKLSLPASVRVVRRSKTLSANDVKKVASDALGELELGRGAKLAQVRSSAAVVVPAGYDRVSAELKPLPRRAGRLSTSATLSFLEGDEVLARVEVPIELDLPKEAAFADVKKGTRLTLAIQSGSVEVRAVATANADADVGEALPITLLSTGKALRARLTSKTIAVLVNP